jgi:hypothetical protein
MPFFANELSLHGQYPDLAAFSGALRTFMSCRHALGDRAVYVAARFGECEVCHKMPLREAVQRLGDRNLLRAVLSLAQRGPFIEQEALYTANDRFLCDGDLVNGTTLAEAACRRILDPDDDVATLSFRPSQWTRHPLIVRTTTPHGDEPIEIANFWDPQELDAHLESRAKPLSTWRDLRAWTERRCPQLWLTDEALEPLNPVPFRPAAARRIQELLRILNRLRECLGTNSEEFNIIFSTYFSGGDREPWFTDESETNKQHFRAEMTFRDPRSGMRNMSCTWHGKIRTDCLRMHFEPPSSRGGDRLCVAYIGPKITRG